MTLQFENHSAFWLFWIVPVFLTLVFFFAARRRSILNNFVDLAWIKLRLPQWSGVGEWLESFLFTAAVICLILALLKPYDGFEMREVTRKGVDLYFLVDLSPSMLAQDIKPSRLSRAKFEMKDFLGLLRGDRVGLIGFSGEPYIFVPLTSDYNAFALFLDELATDLIPSLGTNIADAVAKAVDSLKKVGADSGRAIILITDGEDSIGLDEKIIEQIKAYGIKLYVIGIGTLEGAPVPQDGGDYIKDDGGRVVISKLNEAALKDLSLATGGGYVRSTSGDLDLQEIYFKGIKQSVGEGDGKTIQKKIPHYRFQEFLGLALVFLALSMLATRRRKFWLGKIIFWRARGFKE